MKVENGKFCINIPFYDILEMKNTLSENKNTKKTQKINR